MPPCLLRFVIITISVCTSHFCTSQLFGGIETSLAQQIARCSGWISGKLRMPYPDSRRARSMKSRMVRILTRPTTSLSHCYTDQERYLNAVCGSLANTQPTKCFATLARTHASFVSLSLILRGRSLPSKGSHSILTIPDRHSRLVTWSVSSHPPPRTVLFSPEKFPKPGIRPVRLGQKIQCFAFFYALTREPDAESSDDITMATPMFVANRIAWHPEDLTPELGIKPAHLLLADQGVDIGLLDLVRTTEHQVSERGGLGMLLPNA